MLEVFFVLVLAFGVGVILNIIPFFTILILSIILMSVAIAFFLFLNDKKEENDFNYEVIFINASKDGNMDTINKVKEQTFKSEYLNSRVKNCLKNVGNIKFKSKKKKEKILKKAKKLDEVIKKYKKKGEKVKYNILKEEIENLTKIVEKISWFL